MKEPQLCYGLLSIEMMDRSVKEVTPIIIKEGEAGYYSTDWKWKKEFAEEARDAANAKLGLKPEQAEAMMFRSMFPHAKPEVQS